MECHDRCEAAASKIKKFDWNPSNKYLISFFFFDFDEIKREASEAKNAVKCLSLLKLTGIMIFRHSDCLSRSWLAYSSLFIQNEDDVWETAWHYRLLLKQPLCHRLRQIIKAKQAYLITTWETVSCNFRCRIQRF